MTFWGGMPLYSLNPKKSGNDSNLDSVDPSYPVPSFNLQLQHYCSIRVVQADSTFVKEGDRGRTVFIYSQLAKSKERKKKKTNQGASFF